MPAQFAQSTRYTAPDRAIAKHHKTARLHQQIRLTHKALDDGWPNAMLILHNQLERAIIDNDSRHHQRASQLVSQTIRPRRGLLGAGYNPPLTRMRQIGRHQISPVIQQQMRLMRQYLANVLLMPGAIILLLPVYNHPLLPECRRHIILSSAWT